MRTSGHGSLVVFLPFLLKTLLVRLEGLRPFSDGGSLPCQSLSCCKFFRGAMIPFARKSPPPHWFLNQDRRIRLELGKKKYGTSTLAYERRRFALVRRVSRQRASKQAAGSRPSSLDHGKVTELPTFLK